MRRRALIVTAALTLLLSLSAAPPANASACGTPNRQPLDFQELLSWASSWFTGLWDADGDRGPNLDPDGNPTTGDPLPADERGPNLDPDG